MNDSTIGLARARPSTTTTTSTSSLLLVLLGTNAGCVSSNGEQEDLGLGLPQQQSLNETTIDETDSEPDLFKGQNETIIDAESDTDCEPGLGLPLDSLNETIIDGESDIDEVEVLLGLNTKTDMPSDLKLNLYLSESDSESEMGESEPKTMVSDDSFGPVYDKQMCEVDRQRPARMSTLADLAPGIAEILELSLVSQDLTNYSGKPIEQEIAVGLLNVGPTSDLVDNIDTASDDIECEADWHLYLSDSEEPELEFVENDQQAICHKDAVCHKRKFSEIKQLDPGAKMLEKCCENNCMSTLSINDINICQEQMWSKNEAMQKQFVLSEIVKHTLTTTSSTSKLTSRHRLIIGGKFVCVKAWCVAYSVSNWRFKECLKLHESGKVSVQHGNTGKRNKCQKTNVALAWMTDLFKRLGDYMPHRSIINLPHTWTKKVVYHRMCFELKERNELHVGTISYEHFTRIWLEHLPQFVIPTSTDFTKCTMCTQLQEAYEKAPSNAQRQTIADLKAAHDRKIEAERRAYHQARERSRREPNEMTCVIIDGMDQNKTGVPHLIVKDKDSASLARLPVHFTGVLVHTATPEGKVPFVFYDIKHIPHDSNLTIHCLTEALRISKCRLGKVLFLQMDNCFRENKNKFVLSFAALLVEKDIFKEVYIHFLPVGHTHEDVDQMFSCIARHLRHTNTYTLEDLKVETSKSFTPHISMHSVTAVQDVKSELNNHIYGKFGNHSKPHWFRFRKANQRCYMHYKKWESDLWKPEESEEYLNGFLCLKDVPDLTKHLQWVLPCLDKIDLPKLVKELPASYSHRMSPTAQEWWKCFLDGISSTYEMLPATQQWNCSNLVQNLTESCTPVSACNLAIEEIANGLEAECPAVYIGTQGRPHRGVKEMDSYSSVESGFLVAVHCEEKKGRPFIAEVIKKDETNVLVSWMRGSWSGPWQPWVQGASRNMRPYTSLIPVTSLILWDFHLSNKKRLKKSTVENLKTKYSELDKE